MNRISIIGTAGHVDHGKTAIINRLTGIHTSHLPEEHHRGMTIDLGFAYFETSEGRMIAVMDVPGHERFIRNMAAGMWSLSAIMLVVAADEGWMPMSQEHLCIAHAMGVEKVFLVINKIDKVCSETRKNVQKDAEKHCFQILGKKVNSICVSALSGEGLNELRKAIETHTLEKPQSDVGTHFYIDRHFVQKGVGSIVTGSLIGGSLRTGEKLILHPSGISVRIRGMENHHTKKDTVMPESRVALNISPEKKVMIRRGMCLAKDTTAIFTSQDVLIEVRSSTENHRMKNHLGVELASGTFHVQGIIHFLEDSHRFARVVLEHKVPFLRNQPGVIIRQGGSIILASFIFLDNHAGNISRRKNIITILEERGNVPSEHFDFLLDGYKKTLHAPKKEDGDSLFLRPWLISQKKWMEWKKMIFDFGQIHSSGFTQEELPMIFKKLHQELVSTILKQLEKDNELIKRGNYYFTDSPFQLSDIGKHILSLAKNAGTKGLHRSKLNMKGSGLELKNLLRLGLLVRIGENTFYSEEVFINLAEKIIQGRVRGEYFSIAEAREKSGLSRKFLLPVLNCMEEKNMIRREGNSRVLL